MFAISRSPSRVAVFLLWLPLLGGCGGSDGDVPDLGEVTGVVTLDGEPLADVLVMFEPQTDDLDTAVAKLGSSRGTTNEKGEYELQFNQDNKGAVVATHTVRVFNVDEAEMPVEDLLPEKFGMLSTLTKEVKAESNEINIQLNSQD